MEATTVNIGHQFSDPELEVLAYTHPSCGSGSGNNQRLEFLGDAVLDLVIAEALYHRLAEHDEGVMDRARASLVNGRSLAEKARSLQLDRRIRVSKSQRKHHPEPSDSMLEDVLEALIGAIYLDAGMGTARTCILKIFEAELDGIAHAPERRSPKSQLQEWSQQLHQGVVPEYTIIEAAGPDHKRHYRVSVSVRGQAIGQGEGSSIKSAEAAAAKNALKQMKRTG